MSSKQTLTSLIGSNLHRTDLTAIAQSAVSRAISFFEKERWWFMEARAELTTVTDQTFYALPDGFIDEDSLLITVGGSKSPLFKTHYNELDEKDSGQYNGIPGEYAMYDGQLRLYPKPDDSYTLTFSFVKSSAEGTASQSSAMCTHGHDMTLYRATWDIQQNYLHNNIAAQMAKLAEKESYAQTMKENSTRMSTGKIRKTRW